MGSVSYSGLSVEVDPTVSAQITALDLVSNTQLNTALEDNATQTWVSQQGYAQGSNFISKSGGSFDLDAYVTMSGNNTYDSELAPWGLGVELTSDASQGTTVEYNGVDTYASGQHLTVRPTGITFPDNTIQTTAWTGSAPSSGANFGDIFAIANVGQCYWYGAGWYINFKNLPANYNIQNNGGLAITNADGSAFAWVDGMSLSSGTYLTPSGVFNNSNDYIYVQLYNQRSTNPINYP